MEVGQGRVFMEQVGGGVDMVEDLLKEEEELMDN